MKYPISSNSIPIESRSDINSKILRLIASGEFHGITSTDIFQAYTGEGGLHGLSRADYSSYHAYSDAKKEIEQGQFFTSPQLCREIVSCVPVQMSDLVADLTFGMGNFFNFLPNEANVYGCEIDPKAFKVAQHLYPSANLICTDIRYYRPEHKFDIVFGNPPFNLYWKEGRDQVISQMFFMRKCAELMTSGGILAVITPLSFLSDDFTDGNFIAEVNESFSFLGQAKLPLNAFEQMGVKRYATKVMFFQRRADEGIPTFSYSKASFVDFDPVSISSTLIQPALEAKYKIRHHILFQRSKEANGNNWSYKNDSQRPGDGFDFRLKKLFFEIKTHPKSKSALSRAHNLLHKFRAQEKPADMKHEEWEKSRLTENKVLASLRRMLDSSFHTRKVKEGIEVVRTNAGISIKAHDKASKEWIKVKGIENDLKFYDLVKLPVNTLISHPLAPKLKPYIRQIARKQRAFLNQSAPIREMVPPALIVNSVKSFTFAHKDGTRYHLTDKQSSDLICLMSKSYGGILNWQQGSGKTPSAYCVHQTIGSRFRNTFIAGPPIAMKMTWIPFLERQGARYRLISELSDVVSIQPGEIVVIPMTKLVKYQRHLKRYMRMIGNKALLLMDESDEITNYQSKRTRAVLNVFRKTRYKVLTTGTTTRNHAAEIYGQLELLHNNSFTMLSEGDLLYREVRVPEIGPIIESRPNEIKGAPFPARGGYQHFKASFSPTKATVFGVNKHNQDIYNMAALDKILSSCVLTRTFNDIVGEGKYEIHTHEITQAPWEQDFYQTILEEFHSLLPQFYSSTGNSRKDAMLRIVRQLKTLIKACSIPNLMAGVDRVPVKARKIIGMLNEMDTKVMVGCITKRAAAYYVNLVREYFPGRPVFLVTGHKANFSKRQEIIDQFEGTKNGVLVCTQQSLSSSVNIPSCSQVIMESLPWNISKASQYYFRTIRFDSKQKSNVHFIIYRDSIEVNIMALLVDKERINDFIKTRKFRTVEQVFGDFKLKLSFLEMLIEKIKDEEGKLQIKWGRQKVG